MDAKSALSLDGVYYARLHPGFYAAFSLVMILSESVKHTSQ